MADFDQVLDELPGVAVFHKGKGDTGEVNLWGVGGVEVGIGIDLEKVLDAKVVSGTLELANIPGSEDAGDIFLDEDVFRLFDDEEIDAEWFSGEMVFVIKLQDIFIIGELPLECLCKGGVPINTFDGVVLFLGHGLVSFLFPDSVPAAGWRYMFWGPWMWAAQQQKTHTLI
jgi:hypothetical protein